MYEVTDTYKTLIKQPTRYVGISGAVKLRSGELVTFTDKNIESGSLSITDRLNRRGDFRPGGVYSSGLSIGFTGLFAKTNDLDGAVIRLNYLIYPTAEMKLSEAEIVPLGRFYVDGSTIKRTRSTVRLKADDGLMLFDIPTTERSGTLCELVLGACSAAGVSFGMTQAEFETLPNATLSAVINTSRVQTERDLLMYVGMLTGSFARMTRSGLAVEFVPLTCEKNESTNVIIPVREIAGNIRFSTDFSDDTTRIAKIFMRRNGTALYSTLEVTAGGSEKLATLELDENPLMSGLSDSDVTAALDNLISQLYHCLNRVFDVDFTGDPALEVGDYVRLRGGEIDTSRGYATGMITSQTWTFHGTHRIKCTMPSSLVYSGDDTDTAAVMLLADDTAVSAASTTAAPERVQPKSQIEKELDELRGKLNSGGVAEKLQTGGSDYAIITGENGASILENSVELVKVRVKDFFDLKKSGEYEFYADGGKGFYISVAPSMPQYAMYDNSLSITESGGIVIRANSSVGIDIMTNNIEIKIGTNDVTPILIKAGTDRIHVTGSELFFNGKKVLTE